MAPTAEAGRKDLLSRDGFVQALTRHISGLAGQPLHKLPAPRVLAVDAPWGSGKSWIAQMLLATLKQEDERNAVLIDAFRHDHHSDTFAVIAAAIFSTLKPAGETKTKLLSAAGGVLKRAVPAVVKLGVNAGLELVGTSVDEVSDSLGLNGENIQDGVGEWSEQAVEKYFKDYSEIEKVQKHFVDSLSSVTKDRKKPFVIIVDELDRCKPSFALEMLERIKHLFYAENVVFVLFWNSRSIRDFVSHVYGQRTDADRYLSKFIAKTVAVPHYSSRRPTRSPYLHREFISGLLGDQFRGLEAVMTAEEVSEFAAVFLSNLRDIEKVLYLCEEKYVDFNTKPEYWLYGAFLYVHDRPQFVALSSPAMSNKAIDVEIERLQPVADSSTDAAKFMWRTFMYLRDEPKYSALAKTLEQEKHPAQNEDQETALAGGSSSQFKPALLLIEQALARPA